MWDSIASDHDVLRAGRDAREGPILGPGLQAALLALGRPGREIMRAWSALDWTWLPEAEAALAAPDPEADAFDETRIGTRWRAYRRCGVVCALLRSARRPSPGGARARTGPGRAHW